MTSKTDFLFEIMPEKIWHKAVADDFGKDWYDRHEHRILQEDLSDIDDDVMINESGSIELSSHDDSYLDFDESSLDEEFAFENLNLGGVDL